MSDLDLTTAAQSIADSLGVDVRDQNSLALIQAAVDAATPLIEAQVRERIATDIEAIPAIPDMRRRALREAAMVARGDAL